MVTVTYRGLILCAIFACFGVSGYLEFVSRGLHRWQTNRGVARSQGQPACFCLGALKILSAVWFALHPLSDMELLSPGWTGLRVSAGG
jgi:hypothetical protein